MLLGQIRQFQYLKIKFKKIYIAATRKWGISTKNSLFHSQKLYAEVNCLSWDFEAVKLDLSDVTIEFKWQNQTSYVM